MLENNCVSCHVSSGPGWVTVPLETAGDAAEAAEGIAFMTAADLMPPWPPSDLSPGFKHDRAISEDDKAVLAAWAEAGGGLDVPSDTRLVSRNQAIISIEEDYKITPRDGPYTGFPNPDGSPVRKDEYRCQVYQINTPSGEGVWVKGFQFTPDQTEIVHHAVIFRVPAAAVSTVESQIANADIDEETNGYPDEPGWTCFGLPNLLIRGMTLIQGWAPGNNPTQYPDGYGIYLAPGDIIVSQTHYHYGREVLPDASWITIDVATPEEAAGMTRLAVHGYVTPAEVPCTPEEATTAAERAASDDDYTNMCIRSNALRDITARFGVFSQAIPDLLILQCGGTVNDYNQLDGSIGHSSCDLPVTGTGAIFNVFAHMHEFGSAYRMTLNPDTPRERILLHIPRWDFDWQLNYQPEETIQLEQGDTVRFECWWDRTLGHMPEPRYIVWGEGTEDEMCFSVIATIPEK